MQKYAKNLVCNQKVRGSSPLSSTGFPNTCAASTVATYSNSSLLVIAGKVSTGVAQGLTEPPERVLGGLVGHLSVDLHRDRELGRPRDAHRDTRVNIERGQERPAGTPGVVNADAADTCLSAAASNRRLTARGSIGRPVRVVNTSPSSGQVPPCSASRVRIRPGSGVGS
jgi:hypothetical protein